MDRDVAIRLDGMLLGALGHLDGIGHYLKGNVSNAEYRELIKPLGIVMGNVVELSHALHTRFLDAVPQELRPPAPRAKEADRT